MAHPGRREGMPDSGHRSDSEREPLTATHTGPERAADATLDAPRPNAVASVPAMPGTAGPYQIIEEVARGGMGAIYRVRDLELRRDLAVKVLLPEHAGRASIVQRF